MTRDGLDYAAAEYRHERSAKLSQRFIAQMIHAQSSPDFIDWFEAAKAWHDLSAYTAPDEFFTSVIAKITSSAASALLMQLRAQVGPLSLSAESPIEIAFELAAHAAAGIRGIRLLREDLDPTSVVSAISFVAQKEIPPHRADFLFSWVTADGSLKRLAVECDGHDFHERSAEQASRDRARDRHFQEQGIVVFRFTGSDIFQDPYGCADQALAWIDRRFDSIKEPR